MAAEAAATAPDAQSAATLSAHSAKNISGNSSLSGDVFGHVGRPRPFGTETRASLPHRDSPEVSLFAKNRQIHRLLQTPAVRDQHLCEIPGPKTL